jgi:hypothetical protein
MRTAAIVIDNFLSEEKWQEIQSIIASSDFLRTEEFKEWKDSFYEKVLNWISDRTKELDIWRPHWEHTIPMWSYMNSLPSGIDRESSGGGYHTDFGGFVYYIHPFWDESWDGHLKFKDCDVEKVVPIPNRFVWINPVVWHGIEVVNNNAQHNRITVVGWPEGCVEYDLASIKINTSMEENV